MEVAKTDATAGADPRALVPRVQSILWLAVAIAICFKVLLEIVQQSFFLDGLIYASIGRNLAEGIGTVWAPQFSKTLFPVFAEHPPLMMWLQSWFFRLLGDTVIVDKLFSLATCALSLSILAMIWRRLNGADFELRQATPIVLTLTIIAGRLGWGFANGLLENLLIVFTSLSVYCVVSGYDNQCARRRLCFMVAAGILTALALMTKGPVGLFPLAAPGIYWASFRRPSFVIAMMDTIVIGVVVAAVFGLLWTMEGPRGAVERYVAVQLLTSLSGERGHNGSGLAAFRTFVRVNAYPLLVTAIVLFIGRGVTRAFGEPALRQSRVRRAMFFALTGFSASLPLLVAPRVSSFYFNPSLPYFSAALSVACAPVLLAMLSALHHKSQWRVQLVFVGLLGLSLFLTILHFGRPGDHAVTIRNAENVASQVCSSKDKCEAVVSTCGAAHTDWLLHAYLQRYFRISLDDPAVASGTYLLASDDCAIKAGYRDTGAGVAPYRLIRRE